MIQGFEDVPTKVVVSAEIWNIPDKHERKEALLKYLGRAYPGYKPLKTERPFVICKDERRKVN